ncbi:MAG TPA: amidase family protein [Verrucomicrobiae bacterium]|nr:amidase family protein [Verrucomicrobiae bacterium]
MSAFPQYGEYDALGLAELVRSKQIAARELLEEAIARAERVNPQLNALICKRYDRAREEVRGDLPDGPFTGVPFLMKDLGPELAGVPMAGGSRYFKEYVPAHDGEFTARVKNAGFVVFGKTSTPELGLAPVTEPALFGPCRNPWNLERTTGGSSGGSAAMVAAGVVPMAHGNDMGGSIRIPASCNGLFGMKPSRGRTPTVGGVIGDANADLGLSRSVRDSAALLDMVRQEHGLLYDAPPFDGSYLDESAKDPLPLRIALVRDPMLGKSIHPECAAAADDAARLCESLGHRVEEASPSGLDYRQVALCVLAIFASAIGWRMHAGNPLPAKKLRAGDLEPATWAMLVIAEVLSADDLTTAVDMQRRLARVFDAFLQRYDAVLMPTLAAPPVRVGELALTRSEVAQIEVLARLRAGPLIRKAAEEIAKTLFDWIPYTPVFNLTGQPAISVPLHWTPDGLPVGVMFASRLGREDLLFRLAGQLERARPWKSRRPPVWSD